VDRPEDHPEDFPTEFWCQEVWNGDNLTKVWRRVDGKNGEVKVEKSDPFGGSSKNTPPTPAPESPPK
jgi:hypothetical protein